jgi:uncharacterized protein YidB (DUF937 family)
MAVLSGWAQSGDFKALALPVKPSHRKTFGEFFALRRSEIQAAGTGQENRWPVISTRSEPGVASNGDCATPSLFDEEPGQESYFVRGDKAPVLRLMDRPWPWTSGHAGASIPKGIAFNRWRRAMGLFDNIVNSVGNALGNQQSGEGAKDILGSLLQQGAGGQSSAIIGQLLGGLGGTAQAGTGTAAANTGGLAATLETLAANGLADQVGSWLGNNKNLPVSPDQIRDALGSDQVRQLAASAGLPIDDFLKHLATHLPEAASQSAGSAS